MPEVGDITRFTLIHQMDGVAMRNDMYFQIGILGSVQTLNEAVQLLADAWILASQQVLSNVLSYEVFALENLTRNEARGIATGQVSGGVANSGHPQDQVLVFTEYGEDTQVNIFRRGRFNLSGVAEGFSTGGRLNNPEEFDDIRIFLGTTFFNQSSGFEASPQTRRKIPGSSPPAHTFHRIQVARLNPKFFKLKSRKATLLGV